MALLHTGHDYSNEIIKLGKKSIVLNKIRTSLGNESIGNIITFEDVTNVQNTEIKIRSKLYMRGLAAKYTFDNIIGRSPAILETIKRARTFARVTSNILIFGDTGTGKELFAQSIHNAGDKKNGPFIAVNCAAIPENLMESEFFGYVGGAFTGAVKEGKPGFFELAHEGTIFLDELSEIPFAMQGKLLRTIQESEVMRIGSEKIIHVNTRVICATNKDLKALVGEGRFRDDLYYRLSVLKLHLPSLSERGGDILLLAERFLSEYSDEFKTGRIELSSEAADIILKYSWDGNIRELRNVCEQLVVLNETGTISASDVREILQLPGNRDTRNKAITGASESKNLLLEKVRFERSLIVKALEECGFNKSQAASRLGMNRTTLWKKLKAYKIESRTVIG
jgi:transcriptional regulator with PAS, ATPase and Fis domain